MTGRGFNLSPYDAIGGKMKQDDYQASQLFAKSHPFLQSSKLVHGTCSFVSGYYISLRILTGRRGLRIVDLGTRLAPFNNDTGLWKQLKNIGHTAVLTEDNLIIDFTYRQFDSLCSIPKIYTLEEAIQEWKTVDIGRPTPIGEFNPADAISRDKTMMAALDQVWKWKEELDNPVRPLPLFKHSHCHHCMFLGTYREKDLYYCSQNGYSTVIARASSNDSDYVSGFSFDGRLWLAEARWRARELGLLATSLES